MKIKTNKLSVKKIPKCLQRNEHSTFVVLEYNLVYKTDSLVFTLKCELACPDWNISKPALFYPPSKYSCFRMGAIHQIMFVKRFGLLQTKEDLGCHKPKRRSVVLLTETPSREQSKCKTCTDTDGENCCHRHRITSAKHTHHDGMLHATDWRRCVPD